LAISTYCDYESAAILLITKYSIMDFRKDINGLRAIAVVAVVLFHFGISNMKGGFVGVDIFFVISGFLMTGIIFNKVDRGNFSLIGFYLDRGRRIIPALAFLCFVLLVAGWYLLAPSQYRMLGKHVGGSLVFITNIIFWLESGYFDQASHEKWLLHTWSLSAEWQFYIVYPLIILLLRKWLVTSQARWGLFFFAAFSFLISIYTSGRWPNAAFYLLSARAWEMLAGGLVYLFPVALKDRTGTMLELSGIGLIAFSVMYASAEDIWPGWLASMPVLGAVLVIMSKRSESLLTCNPIAQFIGKTSYSIYLWHWPLVVALNDFGGADQALWVMAAIAASIVLGYLSYFFIEGFAGRKNRHIDGVKPNINEGVKPNVKVGVALVLVGFLGALVFVLKGVPGRMKAEFNDSTKDMVMPLINNGWCFYSVDSIDELSIGNDGLKCELGDKASSVKGLLFGDSYAGHNDPFWDVIASDNHIKINSVGTNWCYPSITREFARPSRSRAFKQCMINRDYLVNNLVDYDFVVFASAWDDVYSQNKEQGFYDAIALAAAKTKLVILMAAPTTFDVNVKLRYERSFLSGSTFDIDKLSKEKDKVTRKANEKLEILAGKYDNVLYLDRKSLFNIDGIPSDVTKDNIPYSLEGIHISTYGSRMSALSFENSILYNKFRERISRMTPNSRTPH
jgi:peptidoglycan/LPS O-acetylase OafA/YrhL